MFTRGTRHFGIWREHHPSRRRHAGRPTLHFVLSLAAAAFVSSLCFFLTWKMRGEFFLIESSHIELATSDHTGPWFFDARPAALTLAVLPGREGVEVVFEKGESFELPQQNEAFAGYVRQRMEALEFQAMLTMRVLRSMSRVQVWPHRAVSGTAVREVIGILMREGFDDFDVALAAREGGKSL